MFPGFACLPLLIPLPLLYHPFTILSLLLSTMSDLSATVTEIQGGFSVAGYEKINYDFQFLDNVFHPTKHQLADCYKKWGRVLAVMDENMESQYGDEMRAYFDNYQLPLTVHAMPVGEKAKNITSLLGIVDAMNSFGIIRKVKYPTYNATIAAN